MCYDLTMKKLSYLLSVIIIDTFLVIILWAVSNFVIEMFTFNMTIKLIVFILIALIIAPIITYVVCAHLPLSINEKVMVEGEKVITELDKMVE